MEDTKIKFEQNWLSKGERIWTPFNKSNTPFYLRIFGFKYHVSFKVMDEPIEINGNFEYKVKYENTILKWFKWTIYKKDKND